MLIREEVNKDQIKDFRKIDYKNNKEKILTSEFIELDLGEFKLLFNKKDWRQVEDLFEKIDSLLYLVIFVVKIATQIILLIILKVKLSLFVK